MPFKSDDRPSDTKSVSLHKEQDARLLAHVNGQKNESGFWKAAGYFYLDFAAWLTTQPGAPEPGLPFVHYQAWLEQRQPPPALQASVDPEAIASAILPAMREILDAALATALAGRWVEGAPAGVGEFDFADAFEGLEFKEELENV